MTTLRCPVVELGEGETAVAAVIAIVIIDAPVKWPKDFPQELFPADIIHKHEKEIFQSYHFYPKNVSSGEIRNA